jgi:hypothetical protein
MRTITFVIFLTALFGIPSGATTLDFEGVADSQSVDDFYSGVTFTNAVAHIAGISLNDAELPPVSGVTVAINENGPISIVWLSAVTDFSGFFTYTAPLTLEFFLSGVSEGISEGAFSDNLALSGDPGSSPNERLTSPAGIIFDSVFLSSAGSYGLDDISFTQSSGAVPEPSETLPAALVVGCVFLGLRRFSASRPIAAAPDSRAA